jgi:hypothetical protein
MHPDSQHAPGSLKERGVGHLPPAWQTISSALEGVLST